MKVAIQTNRESNLLDSLIYYFEFEKIDYVVMNHNESFSEVTNVIYLDEGEQNSFSFPGKKPMIVVSTQKKMVESNSNVNYIITNLLVDETRYTEVQKEYLFKKGIYHNFLQIISELLENPNQYDGMIYDLTAIKSAPKDWIFHFDSITDTYAWLSKKNKSLSNDFIRKTVNFYDEKIYDDSLREINYLTEKIMEIKDKKRVIDLFICTKEELFLFRRNYFFQLLLKNVCDTYSIYMIDKNQLLEKDSEIMNSLLDGVIIYPDCVYRDTYGDELSLGFVDCKKETIHKYNEYFDYVLEKYGNKIDSESDIDEL